MDFAPVCQAFQDIEQTSSRLKIMERLGQLFGQASPDEAKILAYLLTGRVAPLYRPVEFGMADRFVARAIALAAGTSAETVTQTMQETGDIGSTAAKIIPTSSSITPLGSVFEALTALTQTHGAGSQEQKIEQLSALLKQVGGEGAKYITRMVVGKLRLGVSEMTILDGLSYAQTGDKSLHDDLESAYNVFPDIGSIAAEVTKEGASGIRKIHPKLFTPLLPALCQRLPTSEDIIETLGKVCVEPKYDGVRVQLHVSPNKIAAYSRNLEDTTHMYPELEDVRSAFNSTTDIIIDAETIGVDPVTGKIMPFQTTTTRRRKHGIAEAVANVPLRFFVFDILWHNGESLIDQPLSVRRQLLEKTVRDDHAVLTVSPYTVTDDPTVIRTIHEQERQKGLEGVVVKGWESQYVAGRSVESWVKLKESEGSVGKLKDTVDGVVMGYYRGEGKRAGFGIGAFLVGVKKGDIFVSITKVGTGVSDDQLQALFARFAPLKTPEQPKMYAPVPKVLLPDVWIIPEVVVEIAGDDLTKSPNHGAGYAVRFPKLVRIREDKSPDNATTLKEIEVLFATQ